MSQSNEILNSWKANAANWIATVDGNEIESRRLVTNKAITDAVIKYQPHKVLDMGCGEGWLTRALQEQGIAAFGVDAVSDLVENAKDKGGDFYFTYTYQEILEDKLPLVKEVDAVVINFALLDLENSENLLRYLSASLQKGSRIFIQTLHPMNIEATDAYTSGWREGSWKGLQRPFVQPYKWYYRTFGSWFQLFTENNLQLSEIIEPVHPATNRPASVIFILSV